LCSKTIAFSDFKGKLHI